LKKRNGLNAMRSKTSSFTLSARKRTTGNKGAGLSGRSRGTPTQPIFTPLPMVGDANALSPPLSLLRALPRIPLSSNR
jgi:hypothetical protein